jgi:hypothetical protein
MLDTPILPREAVATGAEPYLKSRPWGASTPLTCQASRLVDPCLTVRTYSAGTNARRFDRRSLRNAIATVSSMKAYRGVEHEPRLPMIHDPAAEHRANGAADVETCGDDAEHPARRT